MATFERKKKIRKYPGGRSQELRNERTGMTQEQRREKHLVEANAYRRRPTQLPRTVHTKTVGQ